MEQAIAVRLVRGLSAVRSLGCAVFILVIGIADVSAQNAKPERRASVVIDNFDIDSGAAFIRPAAAVATHQKPLRPAESIIKAGTGNPELDRIVAEAASQYSLDPNLLISVMRQESRFNPHAVSTKGARGLMQLIPSTASRFGVTNIFDPKQNIHAGAQYLRFLMDLFGGDVKLALAGYNAGEGAVIKHGYQIPPYQETRNYVGSILSRYSPSLNNPEPKSAPAEIPRVAEISAAPKAVVLLTSNGRLVFSNNY